MTDRALIVSMIIIIALGSFLALNIYTLNQDLKASQDVISELELKIKEQEALNKDFKDKLNVIEARYQLQLRTVDDRRGGFTPRTNL